MYEYLSQIQYTPSVSTIILAGRTYSSQNVRLTPEKCSTNLRVNTLQVFVKDIHTFIIMPQYGKTYISS
jgi:hypothetical protein